MNFFKLPKPGWKLSDEEQVELARKRGHRAKRLRKPIVFGQALIALVALAIFIFALGILADPPREASGRSIVYIGAVVGVMLGLCLGFIFAERIASICLALEGGPRDDLLAKSWDRMKELERLVEQHGLKPPSAGSPKP